MTPEEIDRMNFLRHYAAQSGLGIESLAAELEKAEQERRDVLIACDRLRDLLVRSDERLRKAESALAQQAEDLLAYKDYYGTSVVQVKHLQGCERCFAKPEDLLNTETPWYCSDYPTE